MADEGAAFDWPEGKWVAVAVTFDVDAESAMLAMDPALAERHPILDRPKIWAPSMGEIAGRLAM